MKWSFQPTKKATIFWWQVGAKFSGWMVSQLITCAHTGKMGPIFNRKHIDSFMVVFFLCHLRFREKMDGDLKKWNPLVAWWDRFIDSEISNFVWGCQLEKDIQIILGACQYPKTVGKSSIQFFGREPYEPSWSTVNQCFRQGSTYMYSITNIS